MLNIGARRNPFFLRLFQGKSGTEPPQDQTSVGFMDKEPAREEEPMAITSGYLSNDSSSRMLCQGCPGTMRGHCFCHRPSKKYK